MRSACPLEVTMYALHVLRWVTEEAISGLHCARACGPHTAGVPRARGVCVRGGGGRAGARGGVPSVCDAWDDGLTGAAGDI